MNNLPKYDIIILISRKEGIFLQKTKKDVLFLLIVILFWMSIYVTTPFLSPHLLALGVGASFTGVILGSYGFSQLILRVPLSVYEDCSKKHKLLILIGIVSLTVGGALPIFTDAPIIFLLSRVLAGVGASTWVSFTVAFTEGSDQVKSRMGKLMAANNFGILISYCVGGVVYQRFGMPPLFVLSACFGVASLTLALCWKPEGKMPPHSFDIRELWLVLRNKNLIVCSLLSAAIQLVAYATALSFVSNYAKENGATGIAISLVSISFYASGTLSAWVFSKGFFAKLKDKELLALCFVLFAVYCVLMPFFHSPLAIILIQIIGGVGRNIVHTLTMAIAPAEIPKENKTTAIGVFQCIYSLGMTAGPIVMGWLLEAAEGYFLAFGTMAAISVAAAVCSMIFVKVKKVA